MAKRLIKCLVLDLDGTLWGGILAEGGVNGVFLEPDGPGAPYHDLHVHLVELAERGLLLAVASKNDYAEATAAMESNPYFLIRDFIVSMKIGWGPKAASLREMGIELGLGLDSFMFLDDSPFEREAIRTACPEVTVPELPRDPKQYVPFLQSLPELDLGSTTAEAANRVSSYRLRSKRAEMAGGSSVAEVNAKLNTTVSLVNAVAEDIPRIAELSQRTNQFNMAGSRFTEGDLFKMLQSDQHEIRLINVKDDLEQLGTVGAVVLHRSGKRVKIIEFLLSCRVLSRDVERAVLWSLATEGLGDGTRHLIGVFVGTDRNEAIASQVYRLNGFELVEGSEEGAPEEWVLDLRGELPRKPPGLTVCADSPPAVA